MLRNAARLLAATCLLSGALVVGARPAEAVGPITCTAAGSVVVVDNPITGLTSWSLTGRGSCIGEGNGTQFLEFTGTGTSKGLGLCGSSGVVEDLSLRVTGTLVNLTTGLARPLLQEWHAPVTTFPIEVPFVIGKNRGAGSISTRIFGECTGSPSAFYAFSYQP
jgi:hypothetical protein